ncbi:MAG TPA: DNA translocase FtsK 4TM domain-containing protein, partial [Casimicrobiaceae bacterium]
MARLLRESWWLLVAASFLYLALTLVTYTKTDAAWSTTGVGGAISNRGGVVGAWLSDLLLYLFGLSAWWWVAGGIALVVLGYRRVVHPDREPEHPLVLAALGF